MKRYLDQLVLNDLEAVQIVYDLRQEENRNLIAIADAANRLAKLPHSPAHILVHRIPHPMAFALAHKRKKECGRPSRAPDACHCGE